MTAHTDNLSKLAELLNMLEQPKDDPYRCEVCGKQHAFWLEGPFMTGIFLCQQHLEEELTEGRGKR